jgi:hypothetical protein
MKIHEMTEYAKFLMQGGTVKLKKMPHQNLEQRREYQKQYREKHRNKEYHKNWMRQRRGYKMSYCMSKPLMASYVEEVLKSIPNPFGSFEKAKYVIYRDKSANIPLYSFVTTCRNTEDCIEIMKEKFKHLTYNHSGWDAKYCRIYKIQDGIKKLIFRDIL